MDLKALLKGSGRRITLLLVVSGMLAGFSMAFAQGGSSSGGTIALVAGYLTDPFFSALKKGAEDAAKEAGVQFHYVPANISAPTLSSALQAAIATRPDGLAFGDWFPKAEDPLVKAAAKSGIPVVAVNSAPADWASTTDAFAFVGQSDYQAGVLAGQRLAEAGVKHGLCIDHAPGAQNIEQRCSGFKKAMDAAGRTTKVLNIPYADSQDPGKVISDIHAALNADSSIDGVLACASSVGIDATKAVQQAGLSTKVTVGSFDLSTPVLNAINDGTLLFTIDQQPYLQGFYAVSVLAQQIKYGLHLVGNISTGPVAITKANVARVIKINKEYHGVRGAL